MSSCLSLQTTAQAAPGHELITSNGSQQQPNRCFQRTRYQLNVNVPFPSAYRVFVRVFNLVDGQKLLISDEGIVRQEFGLLCEAGTFAYLVHNAVACVRGLVFKTLSKQGVFLVEVSVDNLDVDSSADDTNNVLQVFVKAMSHKSKPVQKPTPTRVRADGPLKQLPGIGWQLAERLKEHGLSTPQDLAFCDLETVMHVHKCVWKPRSKFTLQNFLVLWADAKRLVARSVDYAEQSQLDPGEDPPFDELELKGRTPSPPRSPSSPQHSVSHTLTTQPEVPFPFDVVDEARGSAGSDSPKRYQCALDEWAFALSFPVQSAVGEAEFDVDLAQFIN